MSFYTTGSRYPACDLADTKVPTDRLHMLLLIYVYTYG
jgi:hypothetical protein